MAGTGLVVERKTGDSIIVTARDGSRLRITLLCADAGRAKICFAGAKADFTVNRAEVQERVDRGDVLPERQG